VGSSKPSQLNEVNAVQMQTSTQTAVIVALQELGYTVPVQNIGAEVNAVSAKSPADGHLIPGDVVIALDGTPTPTSEALVTAIQAHKPGDEVKLSVQPPSGPVRVEAITLGTSPPGLGTPHAFLGIQTSTKQHATLPVDVTIDPGNVGGPSAGLAFTLGVMNELQTGDLAGGHTVAVTGTIEPDGTVGDVGGVAQKTAAVRKAGAIAFLVPPGEYKTAVQHAGSHLKVIQVSSVDQALNALASLGGNVSGVTHTPPAKAAA
jgi:PDZ domain-containing protein